MSRHYYTLHPGSKAVYTGELFSFSAIWRTHCADCESIVMHCFGSECALASVDVL